MVTSFTVVSYAKGDIEAYQKTSVFIGATYKFDSPNFNHSFTSSASGTGFAVGVPGDEVQYIATCAHVVEEEEGVYLVYIDSYGRAVGCEKQPDGTAYPKNGTVKRNGITYTAYVDYFRPETTELYAIFSQSSNDYTKLTVTRINSDVDLALCKLASDPTDKLNILPLQRKDDVEINTDVRAIGYASTSMVFNAEKRIDSSDSTVKDGIVSKKQRTNGMSGSETTFDTFEVTADLTTGMSGGPVISEETGAIIGVTAFGNTDVTQAASAKYAICIDYLMEMLDAEGIEYEVEGEGFPVWAIILIVAVVMLLAAGAVIFIIILKKKKATAGYVDAYSADAYSADAYSADAYSADAYSADAYSAAAAMKFGETVAPEGPFHLIGLSGYFAGKKYSMAANAVIGRDSTRCNVVYPPEQPGVSGLHCMIRVDGGIVTLTDCGSSFGTFLENGTKLIPNEPVMLRSGDRFFVADRENLFEVRN